MRATVIRDPWGNLSRYMPMLRETFEELRDLGLWTDAQRDFTPAGRVANLLAREINPRRGFYRTVESLAHGLRPVKLGEPLAERIPIVEEALELLCREGLAEPDDDYHGRAPAWRLCRT